MCRVLLIISLHDFNNTITDMFLTKYNSTMIYIVCMEWMRGEQLDDFIDQN
jgi:hypothetical protein